MRKNLRSSWVVLLLCIPYLLLALGCSSAPVVKDASTFSPLIRVHKQFTVNNIYTGSSSAHRQETGIFVEKGEIVTSLPSANNVPGCTSLRIGDESGSYAYHTKANYPGSLALGYHDQLLKYNTGSVDILVWKKEDWPQIVLVLEKLKQKDPENRHIVTALAEAKQRQEIFLAEGKASEEIEAVRKQMQSLKEKPGAKAGQGGSSSTKDSPSASVKPLEENESREKLAQLEQKLSVLMGKQAELEEIKQRFNEERKKADSLAQELEERQKEQEQLRTRLRLGPKTLPVIVVVSPTDGLRVERKAVDLSGVAEADLGMERIELSVNNKLIGERSGGKPKREGDHPRRLEFNERIPLVIGENKIKIRAVDADGLSTEKSVTIHCEESRKNIWAVVIGINGYQKAPQLKYAVNDARAFHDYLITKTEIPRENVILLLNHEASLSKLRSTLGTEVKNKASKEDMVILYFAGHGATEGDATSPDEDGLEKYLLPFDADLKDLYSSALPMREIFHILQRIRSERLVFIIDSCYSGGSGGRTVKANGKRANISDRFLDRMVSGKGTIILTASGANEVSVEKDELRHGVFTYFLLEGLEGKADLDRDGQITVDEVYDYVSKNVPKATGQEQHPVKKGTVEGHLILGILR
jgi:hypothetical protein